MFNYVNEINSRAQRIAHNEVCTTCVCKCATRVHEREEGNLWWWWWWTHTLTSITISIFCYQVIIVHQDDDNHNPDAVYRNIRRDHMGCILICRLHSKTSTMGIIDELRKVLRFDLFLVVELKRFLFSSELFWRWYETDRNLGVLRNCKDTSSKILQYLANSNQNLITSYQVKAKSNNN